MNRKFSDLKIEPDGLSMNGSVYSNKDKGGMNINGSIGMNNNRVASVQPHSPNQWMEQQLFSQNHSMGRVLVLMSCCF